MIIKLAASVALFTVTFTCILSSWIPSRLQFSGNAASHFPKTFLQVSASRRAGHEGLRGQRPVCFSRDRACCLADQPFHRQRPERTQGDAKQTALVDRLEYKLSVERAHLRSTEPQNEPRDLLAERMPLFTQLEECPENPCSWSPIG